MSRKNSASSNRGNTSNRKPTRRDRRAAMQVDLLETSFDQLARLEGPRRKNWTHHDLKFLKPLTQNQELAFIGYNQTDHLFLSGSAGTGKTLLAVFFAIRDAIDPNFPQKSIRIIRSAVSSRDFGFLPGNEDEKMAPFETPYRKAIQFLFGKESTYADMKECGLIQFESSSFSRGDTWTNEIVIVDEVQNMTFHEINTLVTRVGKGTKLILIGDGAQNDLSITKQASGFDIAARVIGLMKNITTVKFTHDDIVRCAFVKEWIITCDKVMKQVENK